MDHDDLKRAAKIAATDPKTAYDLIEKAAAKIDNWPDAMSDLWRTFAKQAAEDLAKRLKSNKRVKVTIKKTDIGMVEAELEDGTKAILLAMFSGDNGSHGAHVALRVVIGDDMKQDNFDAFSPSMLASALESRFLRYLEARIL